MSDLSEIVSLDDLIDAFAAHDRQRAQLCAATARIAASGIWASDGYVSMAAWLQHRCRLNHGDARRVLRDGRFLRRYPAVADAATSGVLSGSQVNAIAAAVTAPTAELFDEHQHGVVTAVTGLGVADTVQVCQQWRTQAEAVVEMPEPVVAEQSWSMTTLDDGTIIGRFVFNPANATQLEHALGTAQHWDGPGDTRPASTRNADAATAVFAFFNANHTTTGTPRHRPHIELHITATPPTGDPAGDPARGGGHEVLDGACAVTANGSLLPDWATDAFLCDCVIHRVLRAGSAVLDYGRATRSVPHHLFRAVANRDGGCRFPGCTRKIAWCDAHHIQWWRNHGGTSLDNLLLLCAFHHHLIHRQHWTITLQPNNEAHFTTPDHRLLTTQPRGQPTIRPPIAA
jgi:Domain of unknown function (DUF222)